MKSILMGAVLTLCSTYATASQCIDEASNQYFIEPYGDNSLLINEIPFHEIRVEEYNGKDTSLHETWLQDSDGAIALISVITNKNDSTATRKLYLIEGSDMSVGICK